jgi:hypothetical protein
MFGTPFRQIIVVLALTAALAAGVHFALAEALSRVWSLDRLAPWIAWCAWGVFAAGFLTADALSARTFEPRAGRAVVNTLWALAALGALAFALVAVFTFTQGILKEQRAWGVKDALEGGSLKCVVVLAFGGPVGGAVASFLAHRRVRTTTRTLPRDGPGS